VSYLFRNRSKFFINESQLFVDAAAVRLRSIHFSCSWIVMLQNSALSFSFPILCSTLIESMFQLQESLEWERTYSSK
jgi:hypothetical protein